MKIVNPNFKLNDYNIFDVRKIDYDKIEKYVLRMLAPAKEMGFEIIDFGIRSSRQQSNNLNKTLKNKLVIRLKKDESVVDLSMEIPSLINDNYIIINGKQKIPFFQLFDIPVVTRKNIIKIRTNVANITVHQEKEHPFVKISFLGKKVPLCNFVFCYYPMSYIKKLLDKNDSVDDNNVYENTLKNCFLYDLKTWYDDSLENDLSLDDHLRSLAVNYTKFDALTKGKDIMFAVDLIHKVDFLSTRFFFQESIIDEIIDIILKEKTYDDMDFRNKRIRSMEYMILSKVAKNIFDFCYTNRVLKVPRFNVNTSQILSECNVSDIVQFDFAINPIAELSNLTRATLVGPGGFSKENIPRYLRDISPSMYGRICPVDTPDRDNCGVITSVIPNCHFDNDLRFSEEHLEEKQIISIPVSFIPFLEHDDPTRLQMACSQMRQAIMLSDFEQPIIKSGNEGLYSDKTQFIKRARKNGKVELLDEKSKMIVIAYDDNDFDVLNFDFRKIYTDNVDVPNVYVSQGDIVKKGDIIFESVFMKNGEICIGKNLLTAVMPYQGWNYEDGIVISDRLIKDRVFRSLHVKDMTFTIPSDKVLINLHDDIKNYKPLPYDKDYLKVGDSYAIMKTMPTDINYGCVFEDPIELFVKNNCYIRNVRIFANRWNDSIPQYSKWIENKIKEQIKNQEETKILLKNSLPKEIDFKEIIKRFDLDTFGNEGNYKNKGEHINGILVEMSGVYLRDIQIGDKIANRHGNKGVIGKILPHESMPRMADGRHVDIVTNPLGIISRMIAGQPFELQLSMSVNDLKRKLKQMILQKTDQEEIKLYLLNYIKIIDNTKDNWYLKAFIEGMPEEINDDFVDELSIIQPPFESSTAQQIEKASQYTETPLEYEIQLGNKNIKLENPIAVGYLYFFKMIHMSEDRLAARGIGPHTKRTMQPVGGRKNRGGQRCGEMETACIAAHGAHRNLEETLTVKSDCIDAKNAYIKSMVEGENLIASKIQDPVPESVKLLISYLTVIGVLI